MRYTNMEHIVLYEMETFHYINIQQKRNTQNLN
jgi:hypothetical protein